MNHSSKDRELLREIERDMRRWREAQDTAEELVLDRGWKKTDEDYWFQVEEEAKRQWEKDWEREFFLRHQCRIDDPTISNNRPLFFSFFLLTIAFSYGNAYYKPDDPAAIAGDKRRITAAHEGYEKRPAAADNCSQQESGYGFCPGKPGNYRIA